MKNKEMINKIYNEDCLEGMKRIEDKSIDLVVTDPPYKITSRGNSLAKGMMETKASLRGNIFKHNNIKFKDYVGELYRILKEGGHCYIMVNQKNLKNALDEVNKVGFKFIKSLIWDKGNKIVGTYYMSQFEYILFLRKGRGVPINNKGTGDILSVKNKKTKGKDGKNIHNTEKPVELMKILIENSSKKGETVLDPFIGSGTTALACIETERNYIGFELDEEYYNISKERIEGH